MDHLAATSEVLRAISSSRRDPGPVLKAVAEHAARLCDADISQIFQIDGELLRVVASHGPIPSRLRGEALRITRGSVTGRAVTDRRTIHVHDLSAELDTEFPDAKPHAGLWGHRTTLATPLLREGTPIGAIFIRRTAVRPFSQQQIALLETFADQAVIAIENVRLFNETKEALERQTATAEILSSISGSMTDTKPVFDAIVRNLLRLFGTRFAAVVLLRDGKLELAGIEGERGYERLAERFPVPLDDRTIVGRVVLAGQVMQFAPMVGNPAVPPASEQFAREFGFNAQVAAPMIREGKVIGAIATAHRNPVPFNDKQVALLKSFAHQAVIAIENVRLFNETKEALERQTATAEILKVISNSPTDTRPVFEAIVKTGLDLFGGMSVGLLLVAGNQIVRPAHALAPGVGADPAEDMFPLPLDENSFSGRAVLRREVVHVPDVGQFSGSTGRGVAERMGFQACVFAPMMHEGKGIGAIGVLRAGKGPFTGEQIELLQTFAAQAVIAIQNVRLFNETKEALERQTATAEILKVITSSPNDVQPVFDAIIRSAVELCGAMFGTVMGFDGKVVDLIAHHNMNREGLEAHRRTYPKSVSRDTVAGCAILDREVINVAEARDPKVPPRSREMAEASGFRSVLVVPMLCKGEPIGVINVSRAQPGPFSPAQVEILKTFADQAVIAIENVRLFKELQERTEALTKSVGQLTALGEVGQAVSSTLDLETVLTTIVARAVQLAGLDGGAIYEYDERIEEFQLRASEKLDEQIINVLRRTPIRKGEGAVGATAVSREPTEIRDTLDESYQNRLREQLVRAGYRAVLAVPLLREDHMIGALAVLRKTPGAFAPEVVELLKTFAAQSALAIQNARLFREIAEKGRQLEVASQHKSQFLASMSHELRTPLNAILGFNEMILDQIYGAVSPEVRSPLEEMQSSGKHLLRLINNVLDLAKIEAGRMELALADYSVQDTVESVRSTLRPIAAEKGLELLTSVAPDIPLARGDAGRISQCLLNLVGNSLKFTKAGKVEIGVKLVDGLLVYRVTDTGIGIPADKIGSLFTEFKQTDATIASEYGGTGLGLSITKKFIEMHGGRIGVESEPSKGSAFIFEIPLRA